MGHDLAMHDDHVMSKPVTGVVSEPRVKLSHLPIVSKWR
jgi:hypothetical protein